MKSKVLYRVAAVLLVLFAAGHQIGFRSVDPGWSADALVRSMQTTQFTVEGFRRTYWGFYSGFGFFVTVFLLFAAVLAWELSRAPVELRRAQRLTRWSFAATFVVITLLTWSYFFVTPGVVATLIASCLVGAAFDGSASAELR